LRSLNLDQLHSFVEVVQLCSFTAAARRLGLSQPAVSLQIRQLEARCGLQLVERVGKTVLPTPAGRDLIAHAERIRAEAERALEAMQVHKDGGAARLRIGTGPTILAFLLPPVLLDLRERCPSLELAITTGTVAHVVDQLLSNAVDLGFAALPLEESELLVTPVRTDEMMAMLPAGEADIPDVITPADVARRTLIGEFWLADRPRLCRAWMQAGGFPARPALVLDSMEARIAAVAAGLGMGFMPKPAGSDGPSLEGTVLRPLDPPLIRTLGLVQLRGRRDDPALLAVREAILRLGNLPTPQASTPQLEYA